MSAMVVFWEGKGRCPGQISGGECPTFIARNCVTSSVVVTNAGRKRCKKTVLSFWNLDTIEVDTSDFGSSVRHVTSSSAPNACSVSSLGYTAAETHLNIFIPKVRVRKTLKTLRSTFNHNCYRKTLSILNSVTMFTARMFLFVKGHRLTVSRPPLMVWLFKIYYHNYVNT